MTGGPIADPASLRQASFAPLVRYLASISPGLVEPGVARRGADEAVRFRPVLSLAYPLGDVAEVIPPGTGSGQEPRRWTVELSFLGLYGPSSPLAAGYSERLLDGGDHSAERTFLDLFNHRAAALFFQAACKYRPASADGPGGSQAIADRIGRLIGNRSGPDPARRLGFAALLLGGANSAEALERLTGAWFALPCTVDQCVPRWTPLEPGMRLALGRANCALGEESVAGSMVQSAGLTFRLTVGPVSWRDADPWLPGRERHAQLLSLIGMMNANDLDYEAMLIIDTSELPVFPLGHDQAALGRTARLDGPPPATDLRCIHRKE